MADLDTTPKPFVFVLMPFSNDFTDIYEVGIKQACKDAGAYCERVDEQFYDGTILERIYNQIAKADIIISDMTGRNPNVFYETGYAHALGKQVILLTQNSEDIPFDLKNYPHITYEGRIARLKAELEKKLKWVLEHPKEAIWAYEFKKNLYINGKLLSSGINDLMNIRYKTASVTGKYIIYYSFQIDTHNPTEKVYDWGKCEIGLIAAHNLKQAHKIISVSKLPDGQYIYIFGRIGSIVPGAWRTLLEVNDEVTMEKMPGDLEMIIRVFTEFGVVDFPIRIHFETGKNLI